MSASTSVISEDTLLSQRSDVDEFAKSLNSLHFQRLQQCTKFALYTSDARESTDPNEVSEVTIKIYAEGSAGEQEAIALGKLKDLYEDSLPIASFINSYISHNKRYIFVKHLEKPLAHEIEVRARTSTYWSEEELWEHMWSITRAIFQVHFVGFVHRNITPHSLFLKQGKLYLFHFEHCKELRRGGSEHQATIRGTRSFLSPQAVSAIERQAGARKEYTYNVARKDDVWGLGRTLLDMATLRLNDTLQDSYHLSPAEFSEHIRNLIGTGYSSLLKNAITSLLDLVDSARPSFQDFYDWMSRLYRVGPCLDCHQRTVALWPCEHIRCERCLEQALIRHVRIGSDKIRLCPSQMRNIPLPSADKLIITTCPSEIPPECFERYTKAAKLASLIRCPTRKCLCPRSYSVLNANNEPEFMTCVCGAQFCSFCKSTKKHRLLGVRKMCPGFANLMRQ